jgi:hypothetical protein
MVVKKKVLQLDVSNLNAQRVFICPALKSQPAILRMALSFGVRHTKHITTKKVNFISKVVKVFLI